MLIPPIQHLAEIEVAEANKALVAWEHRMGACSRPSPLTAHGMFEHGRLVAVTILGTLMKEHTVDQLSRSDALELARLCAARADLCRVMLRLWREMVFPAFGKPWAISYQDEALHSGDTYRFDGWLPIGRSRSGTDLRSGRRGRNKTVWGWHADAAVRQARRERDRYGSHQQGHHHAGNRPSDPGLAADRHRPARAAHQPS